MMYIRFIKLTYCHTLVSPGMGATVHTFFLSKVLIMDDFPVFGPPTRPTEICFLSECKLENCLRSWMREPLPNELVMLAWNARVGYSLERCRTQAACAIVSSSVPRKFHDGVGVHVCIITKKTTINAKYRHRWPSTHSIQSLTHDGDQNGAHRSRILDPRRSRMAFNLPML